MQQTEGVVLVVYPQARSLSLNRVTLIGSRGVSPLADLTIVRSDLGNRSREQFGKESIHLSRSHVDVNKSVDFVRCGFCVLIQKAELCPQFVHPWEGEPCVANLADRSSLLVGPRKRVVTLNERGDFPG